MHRTACGEVTKQNINDLVLLIGWVQKLRKLGHLTFIDLRDSSGIVQIVSQSENDEFITKLQLETLIKVQGKVVVRKKPNPKLATGQVEIIPTEIEIISTSETLPFVINDQPTAHEELRLTYRYLDLRRNILQNNLRLRSKVNYFFHRYLQKQQFVEIETPILGVTTPEGARDFTVENHHFQDVVYGLPQSPQLYKQILMHASFEKYYQIARCFRDEDLRKDRQLEFSQLDLEMAFLSSDEIMAFVEEVLCCLMQEIMNISVKTFLKLPYEEAMYLYGSDKPDIRFEMHLQHNPAWITTKEDTVVLVVDQFCSKQVLAQINVICEQYQFPKMFDGKILANKKFIAQEFPFKIKADLMVQQCGVNKHVLVFVDNEKQQASKVAGAVRFYLGKALKLYEENTYAFLWITNWPLFHYSESEQRYKAVHHPFTKPAPEQDETMQNWKSEAYDVVCNGYELGGGSLRINDAQTQRAVFEFLNMPKVTITKNFGWLLEALKYSPVQHGGFALGIDRLLMLLTKSESIRDVIAFPKNNQGFDLMAMLQNNINHKE